MKRMIRNWLATTGLSLLLLATVAALYGGCAISIVTVFQAGLADLIIYLGLELLRRFEGSYFLVEAGVEVGYVLAVLVVSDSLFGWYESTPSWVLIFIGIAICVISCLVGVFRIRSDVDPINRQLQLRRKTGGKAG